MTTTQVRFFFLMSFSDELRFLSNLFSHDLNIDINLALTHLLGVLMIAMVKLTVAVN